MKRKNDSVPSIDSYIEQFPADVKEKLNRLRETIRKAAPKATEAIKYAMPTFVQDGNLVHFAAYKRHIGFYPTPTGIENFQKELVKFLCSKGAIQFPLDNPIPLPLVAKIVKFRVKENQNRAKMKSIKKK